MSATSAGSSIALLSRAPGMNTASVGLSIALVLYPMFILASDHFCGTGVFSPRGIAGESRKQDGQKDWVVCFAVLLCVALRSSPLSNPGRNGSTMQPGRQDDRFVKRREQDG